MIEGRRILVTGSSGHLGDGLVRMLRRAGREAVGVDLSPGPFTSAVGSIVDRAFVRSVLPGVDSVVHTATLHKPHVATHPRQAFVDTNVTGTLTLLEEALAGDVERFVFTSTTSAFGHALHPDADQPAAWITEDVACRPKNIYGATKLAAEELCELVHREEQLPCIVLRTSRFFPEDDDRKDVRDGYAPDNAKANEYLYRRVDLQDAVDAHLAALARADDLGFGRYIVSATTPFSPEDVEDLRTDPTRVVARIHPEFEATYARLGWRLFPSIDRVYVNANARRDLGWKPRIDFGEILHRLERGEDLRSELAMEVGSKGYHAQEFDEGPYPVGSPDGT